MIKKICFDLDGVICTNTYGNYKDAKPLKKSIDKVNKLFDEGYFIIIYTSRFMTLFNNDIKKINTVGYDFTKKQLDDWGLKYNKLLLCKPEYDLFIDDKSINFTNDWYKIIDKYL